MQTPTTVCVQGFSIEFGQSLTGPSEAPAVLRANGLISRLLDLGWRIQDEGDCGLDHLNKSTRNADLLIYSAYEIARICETKCPTRAVQLNLGGDHSIAAGTVLASLRRSPNVHVIWIDAHGDMNTPKTSPSGNLHGMPLAVLLGEIRGIERRLRPSKLTLFGVRDLDAGEINTISRLGIRVYGMGEIRQRGMRFCMEEALAREEAAPIHLSLDIDSMDPSEITGTGLRVEGGLLSSQMSEGLGVIRRSKRLIAMDLVEINPRIESRLSSELGIRLISAALGAVQNSLHLAPQHLSVGVTTSI